MNVFHVSLYTLYLERLAFYVALLYLNLPSPVIIREAPCAFKKETAAKILDAKYIAIKRLPEYLQ